MGTTAESDLLTFQQTSFVPREVWESMGIETSTPQPGIHNDTRWGLRPARGPKDRVMVSRDLGSWQPGRYPLPGQGVRRHGSRTMRDRHIELMTPYGQIGAQWCAPDPVYERVEVLDIPHDPGYEGDFYVLWHSADQDPIEADRLEEDWIALNNEAYNRSKAVNEVTGDILVVVDPEVIDTWDAAWQLPEDDRVTSLLPSEGLKGVFFEDGRFQALTKMLKRHTHVGDRIVRPRLVEAGQEIEAWDRKTLFSGSNWRTRSTIDLLWLVASSLVGDKILSRMDYERIEAERRAEEAEHADDDTMDAEDLLDTLQDEMFKATDPEVEVKATTSKKTKKRKKDKTKKTNAPKPPSPWKIWGELLRDCLFAMRDALGSDAPSRPWPSRGRQKQFDRLARWAEEATSRREVFLRQWRFNVIRIAAGLRDVNRTHEHNNPGLATKLSYADNERTAREFVADDIRRFLEGHPDDLSATLEAFENGWTTANRGEVRGPKTAADPKAALTRNGSRPPTRAKRYIPRRTPIDEAI